METHWSKAIPPGEALRELCDWFPIYFVVRTTNYLIPDTITYPTGDFSNGDYLSANGFFRGKERYRKYSPKRTPSGYHCIDLNNLNIYYAPQDEIEAITLNSQYE